MTATAESLQGQRRRARTAPRAVDFLHGGGWRAVSPRSGDRCGLTAHRGVLHPGEYIDHDRLSAMVEQELGFTHEQLRSVYRQGRLSASQRELRGRLDARLLTISRAGGNMSLLARIIGLGYDPAIKSALRRARETEAACSSQTVAIAYQEGLLP